MLRPTPGDPWGVEQYHWNTGAEENQQLNPGGPRNRQNLILERLRNHMCMATGLVAKYCSLLLSFKNKLIQILQVGLLVVLFQVRDSTSNLSWYISYYELVFFFFFLFFFFCLFVFFHVNNTI